MGIGAGVQAQAHITRLDVHRIAIGQCEGRAAQFHRVDAQQNMDHGRVTGEDDLVDVAAADARLTRRLRL